MIEIDIHARRLHLDVADDVLAERRSKMDASRAARGSPVDRQRPVSTALRAYARLASSASTGAVRDLDPARLIDSLPGGTGEPSWRSARSAGILTGDVRHLPNPRTSHVAHAHPTRVRPRPPSREVVAVFGPHAGPLSTRERSPDRSETRRATHGD